MRQPLFFLERPLRRFAGGKLLRGPATGDRPFQANIARSIDKQDLDAQLVPPGFEQERRIE